MNASLLAKWRWRLLDGNGALWKDVLFARYGVRAGGLEVSVMMEKIKC